MSSSRQRIRGGSYHSSVSQLSPAIEWYATSQSNGETDYLGFRVFRSMADTCLPPGIRRIRGGDRGTRYMPEYLCTTSAAVMVDTYTTGPTTLGIRVFRPVFTNQPHLP